MSSLKAVGQPIPNAGPAAALAWAQNAIKDIENWARDLGAGVIPYTGAGSGLTSKNVQDAIDEAIVALAALAAATQPLDADLTAIAALTPSNDDIIQCKAGVWTNRTVAQYLADLGITAWTAYTPTVTSGTGTFTAVSATGRWAQIRKTILVQMEITITTNNTAGTSVKATLPVTSNSSAVLTGRENNSTGKMLQGQINGAAQTLVTIFNYDNTYPGGSGFKLFLSGSYEAQ